MARGKTKTAEGKQPDLPNDDDTTKALARPRSSRFKEGTMNSTASIHVPPDEFWKGLEIETMLKAFNEENNAPASATGVVLRAHSRSTSGSASRNPSASGSAPPETAPAPATSSEGTFGRLWRPISTFFNGAGATISALGKRKAGNENAEIKASEKSESADKAKGVDKHTYDSKAEVEAAYHRAKDLGLMPTPKIFIRPVSRARKNVAPSSTPETPTAPYLVAPVRDPAQYKTPSKKDEKKQRKLSKRVSDLEAKLASTRKELLALSPNVPPVPALPATLPSPPTSQHFFSENETSPHAHVEVSSKPNATPSKIVKKRKAASDNDGEYKPIATDSDHSLDSERESKRSKSTASKKIRKQPSRLLKKKSAVVTTKEEVVIMVPDGENVPPIPAIPDGISGKKVLRKIKRSFGIGKY